MDDSRRHAEQHFALVSTDNPFQRRARLLQSLWREARDLPRGEHNHRPLGSRLAMPQAEEDLANYLTEGIREVVRREVVDRDPRSGKLYSEPRIFNDLLSSQPMAFNLFAELQTDLALATRVFKALTDGRVRQVTAVEFEHSPGRGDPEYTGDRSAFDVYVEYTGSSGNRGFVGIEVKYHEGLGDVPSPHRERYDEIADATAWFPPKPRLQLMSKPLQQIWRDHLLACSMLVHRDQKFGEGMFVFLYPSGNERCANAVELYRECLTGCETFEAWTLEDVVAAIKAETSAEWIGLFEQRYLAFPSGANSSAGGSNV